MRRATSAGMVRAGSPLATLKVESWGERDIGALLMLFLAATVQAGAILGVDPYGQPGVESAKLDTKQLLAEPDGAASLEIGGILGEDAGSVVP